MSDMQAAYRPESGLHESGLICAICDSRIYRRDPDAAYMGRRCSQCHEPICRECELIECGDYLMCIGCSRPRINRLLRSAGVAA